MEPEEGRGRISGAHPLQQTALLVIVTWGCWAARPFLIPVCVSMLLAFLIAPLIQLLIRFRLPESLSIVLGAALLFAPIPFLGYLLLGQIQSLIRSLPALFASFNAWIARIGSDRIGKQFHLASTLDPGKILAKLTSSFSEALHIALSSLSTLLGATSQIVLVFTFTILMLATRKHLRRSCEDLLAMSRLSDPSSVLDRIVSLIERFLVARFIIVLIVGVADSSILWGFGIPYQFLLGSFMGLMTLLPAIGFILSAIPPIIVSFATGNGPLKSAFMFLALTGMSAADTYLFTPKFVGNRLDLNSLASFLGIFGGGLLWGIPGMLLSIPILGILRVIFSAFPGLEPWGELLAEREIEPAPHPRASRKDRRRAA